MVNDRIYVTQVIPIQRCDAELERGQLCRPHGLTHDANCLYVWPIRARIVYRTSTTFRCVTVNSTRQSGKASALYVCRKGVCKNESVSKEKVEICPCSVQHLVGECSYQTIRWGACTYFPNERASLCSTGDCLAVQNFAKKQRRNFKSLSASDPFAEYGSF